MPRRDNDNLESFFRKVSDVPDIPFNDEDWKKLEARIDAKELQLRNVRNKRNRLTGAVVLAVLLMTNYFWLAKQTDQQPAKGIASDVKVIPPGTNDATMDVRSGKLTSTVHEETVQQREVTSKVEAKGRGSTLFNQKKSTQASSLIDTGLTTDSFQNGRSTDQRLMADDISVEGRTSVTEDTGFNETAIQPIDNSKASHEVIQTLPEPAEENKQRANIDPHETEDGDVTVRKLLGGDSAKVLSSPRLSLLLSLAPDFSSTSFGEYSDPGEAFGVMIHYHIKNAWSISTGIVKSNKKYTGNGEDYSPPKGYWKHYTNGIVPASVDGSCTVLEIPVMIQYTVASPGRSKFKVGAGASSYIMLDESYQYSFEEPNPGAKEGWSSEKNSGFLLNMINFTIGYEYQILPRTLLGVEPYLKIPIEEIGWSNLKLFSTGVSVTLRYSVLNKKPPALSTRSRGPD